KAGRQKYLATRKGKLSIYPRIEKVGRRGLKARNVGSFVAVICAQASQHSSHGQNGESDGEEARLRQGIHGFSPDLRNHRASNRFHYRCSGVRGRERTGQRPHKSDSGYPPSRWKPLIAKCHYHVTSHTEASGLPLW